jgi:hypothetical protein
MTGISPHDDCGGIIRTAGWRQGDLLLPAIGRTLIQYSVDRTPSIEGEVWLIVVTQDCDLRRSDAQEPFVELIALESENRTPGSNDRGQSSRNLVLKAERESHTSFLRSSTHNRFRVKKSDFIAQAPCRSTAMGGFRLCDGERQILVRWLARRYTRPSFSDEFENCLMVSCNPVKALFKSPEARHVSTIFVRIEDEVPLEGEPFLLHAILAAPVHCFEDRATLEEMQRFERRFVDVISSRPRIQFARKYSDDEASIDVRLLPEEDVTLADLQDYKRLDADYRSVDDDDASSTPHGLED